MLDRLATLTGHRATLGQTIGALVAMGVIFAATIFGFGAVG